MGGLLAVAAGLRRGAGADRAALRGGGGAAARSALVGKAVTFDTGGISIKPAAKMQEMKMDMSGGAAVLEATAAIAELGLAGRPGRGRAGDREHAERDGDAARRHHHAAQRQDGRGEQHRRRGPADPRRRADLVRAPGRRADRRPRDADRRRSSSRSARPTPACSPTTTSGPSEVGGGRRHVGELAWRLPLHREYKDLTRGKIADLVERPEQAQGGVRSTPPPSSRSSSTGTPWAHLDIAGTAWDVGREYVGKGATGYGVRLLVELARIRRPRLTAAG